MADPILRERLAAGGESRLDIYVFFVAFCGGLALYFALKRFGVGQLGQTAAVVSTMLAYAFAVARVPRLRVRLDQAGDNAYYLGLLFTLVSMAVALYEFRASALGDAGATARSGAEQIIANFGVALGSTIAGIFLRVLLHQMRVDPGDVESMTRIELAEASKRVKAHLDEVSGNMALTHGQTVQRMNDVIVSAGETLTATLTAFTTEVGAAMVALVKRTAEAQNDIAGRASVTAAKLDAVAEHTRAAMESLAAVVPPPALAAQLASVADGLSALSAPLQAITASLEQATGRLGLTVARLEAAGRENREQQGAIALRLSEAAEQFGQALAAAGETLRQDKALLTELEGQAKASSEQTLRVHEAADKVLKTFTEVTRDLTALVRHGASPPPVAQTSGQSDER